MIGVSLGLVPPSRTVPSLNAFSPLRARLIAGQNTTIFINADSTAYADSGPFHQFAMMLGDLHNANVVLYRWAEWQTSAPTGPKAYADPVRLRTGAGPTITVYLAALPGGMAGFMLADHRANALKIPRPDLCIMHQGHNMQSFEAPGGILSSGRATLLGPLGMTAWRWPGVAQLITTQNPWRHDNGYDKVYQAILDVARAHPGLTLVDTHAAFMARNKDVALYRDNIHPNDAGAGLVAQSLFSAFLAAAPGTSFETPCWPKLPTTNLIANGDFTDWSGLLPAGWGLSASGSAVKATDVTFSPAFAYSLALRANGNQAVGLLHYFRGPEAAAMIGKTISFAILYRHSEGQRLPFIMLIVKSGGISHTINMSALQFGGAEAAGSSGWMWATANEIKIDPDLNPDGFDLYLHIYPAFGISPPSSDEPLYIQRIIATEGPLPKGNLSD
ncbi:SGNH/GDSL hydrolase family protein [Agrobacterium sp. NPDC089420]|uniref:SGNH/GDSL hydrolase family protein n=1 Tax=Agrobacterium sp. NPDC089420 TaxID=3363918 RepID=UPI00384B0F1E